jgi:methylase of polypeptide subunit release factors
MEIDASQGDAVKNYAQQCVFTNVEIQKDQFDRDRTLFACP